MLDIKLVREQPELVRKAMLDRQEQVSSVDKVLELDERRRSLIQHVETLKAQRNIVTKEIGMSKDQGERERKIEAMRQVGERISELDDQLREVQAELDQLMSAIPNIPDPSTPYGTSEDDNVFESPVGEPPVFDFDPKPHWELGPELGIIDFEQGVKVTGSRFYVLSGAGARLQRALIAFMLDLHIRQGYTEKYPPFMVKSETLYGAGQLPKFADNLYRDHEEDLWMVPTAEVPLTGLHMDEILEEDKLPLLYTAYTPCFRREKMSAGREVRGMKRGHQFDKVEMYIFCKPEDSRALLSKMVGDAEGTCRELGLRYRRGNLCTGDLGFGASITYDIEVWAAGSQEWMEVSSISNDTDFQARRSGIRYKSLETSRNEFVHTLNGSGLGLPRTFIAVLENYQQSDGSVVIPEVLQPWMGGIEIIRPE